MTVIRKRGQKVAQSRVYVNTKNEFVGVVVKAKGFGVVTANCVVR